MVICSNSRRTDTCDACFKCLANDDSSSSNRGCFASTLSSTAQISPKRRFQIDSFPSALKTAMASNKLSKVAVRTRNKVSRALASCASSVRSSKISNRPPSGVGCAKSLRCVPSGSSQFSSTGAAVKNQFSRSVRHKGKSRTSGIFPLSRIRSNTRTNSGCDASHSSRKPNVRWNGKLAKLSVLSGEN